MSSDNQEIMKAIGGLQADMKNLSGWLRSEIETSKTERKEIHQVLHGKDMDKAGMIERVRDLEDGQRKQTKVITGIVILMVGGVEAIKTWVKMQFPGLFGG